MSAPVKYRTPWEAVPSHLEGLCRVMPVDHTNSTCPVVVVDHSRDGDEATRLSAIPIARLIAAAPDLLEVVEVLSGEDGFLLDQIATMIGGMIDGGRFGGLSAQIAEGYITTLRCASEGARAAIAKAREVQS